MHKAACVTSLAVENNDSVSYNAQMSKLLRDEKKYQLLLLNPRDALHRGKRAASKGGCSM